MKYFISYEYDTVYYLAEVTGRTRLMETPIHRDHTFDTNESAAVEFENVENETFIYCKGVQAFLERLQ